MLNCLVFHLLVFNVGQYFVVTFKRQLFYMISFPTEQATANIYSI